MDEEVAAVKAKIEQLELRFREEEKKQVDLDRMLNEMMMTQERKQTTIEFTPPSSQVEPTFFKELGERKLNLYKLNEDLIDIHGAFSPKFNRVEVRYVTI